MPIAAPINERWRYSAAAALAALTHGLAALVVGSLPAPAAEITAPSRFELIRLEPAKTAPPEPLATSEKVKLEVTPTPERDALLNKATKAAASPDDADAPEPAADDVYEDPAGGEVLSSLGSEAGAPINLTGLTLGAGSARIGRGGSGKVPPSADKPRPQTSRAPASPVGSIGPSVVPITELSAPPVPPSLAGALAAAYPTALHRSGIEGSASVRALIGPVGSVLQVELITASEPRFGSACRGVVAASTWSPPRDAQGRAVSTRVRYDCRFRVDR